MSMIFLAKTLDIVGSVLIAYAALRVHHRFLAEHKVDERVFKIMKREGFWGVLGVFLIIAGYFVDIFFVL